ncbi:hypothetical protein WKH56_07310 [Priestia sp. SB1]|uniref:Uncharacterized protein n=1 Tax=Priestia aryabhattai TaxID=412384 RepID=A0AAX6NBC2_PRIAR|nr:hypothetical protein [Priestia aryabhattai]MDU9693213.1 hypothetical protein [Priestia aryabhattai]NGY88406.1 hypothetical protein [Priestia megaterium]
MARPKKQELEQGKIKELEKLVDRENKWLTQNQNGSVHFRPESDEELLVVLRNIEEKMSDDVKRRIEVY